ncbi:MAG: GDSL-type esterase/lipase family protein [Eubacteriales bacterium]|nr:GDSL-type esterase/lipase family protein [Eubacteriales bacterium]
MKKVRVLLLVLCIFFLCASIAFFAFQVLTDQSQMDKTFYQVVTDKLDVRVRAVFLSDLHLSVFGTDNCDLIASVANLKPDIILIGGDMNIVHEDYAPVLSLCRELVKIAPVYYGLGNHELTQIVQDGRQIYDDLAATGVVMLNDTYQKVTVGGCELYIGGLSESGGGIETYSKDILGKLSELDGFKLLLSHYPSNFGVVQGYDIDLMLSGHLHGGQVRLPYLGGLYSYEDGFLPDYTEGMFTEQDTTMIVSRGLGNSHQLPRVNNPPELVIVDFGASDALTTAQKTQETSLASAGKLVPFTADASASGGKLQQIVEDNDLAMEDYSSQLLKGSAEQPATDTQAKSSTQKVVFALQGVETYALLSNLLSGKEAVTLSVDGVETTEQAYRLPDATGLCSFSVATSAGETLSYDFTCIRAGQAANTQSDAKVMIIGDSFTERAVLPCTIKRIVTQDFGMSQVSFVGRRTAKADGMECAHEGYGGYGFEDLLKMNNAEGRGENFPNPYCIDGKVSVAAYLAQNGLPTPDVFVVYQGLNDLTHYGTGKDDVATVVCSRAQAFIDLLRSEFPNASILLCGPVYVSDGNGQVNAATFNGRIDEINEAYESLCAQAEYAQSCTYVNSAFTFDRNNAFDTVVTVDENGQSVTTQTDWIHPAEAGFRMIANPIAAALIHRLSPAEQ